MSNHLRSNTTVILSLVCFLTIQSAVWAQKPGHGRGEYFNVRDFGAKGAGGDDTEGIKAAIAAATRVCWGEKPPGSVHYASEPVVFFPSGKYKISETLQAGGCNLLGEGSSIIHMTDPEKDIFFSTSIWRWRVSGLLLFGGRHQLHIGNANINSSQFIIDKCTFQKASGVAIKMGKRTASAQLIIKNCMFTQNNQALVNRCDQAVLKDSWISTSKGMKDKAVIENHNVLRMENIVGVPEVDPRANQRWIDNHFSLTCRNVRFGGEGGGFTAVFNFAKFINRRPQAGSSSVVMESCFFFCARNDKIQSAIYLEEVPNQLIIRDSSGFISGGGRGWPVVKVSPKMDLDTYFDDVRVGGIRILIDDTLTTGIHDDLDFFTELPEQLKPYQVNDIVSDAAPKSGNWRRGQFVRNRNTKGPSAAGAPYGWYCVESGKSTRWKPVFLSFVPR